LLKFKQHIDIILFENAVCWTGVDCNFSLYLFSFLWSQEFWKSYSFFL